MHDDRPWMTALEMQFRLASSLAKVLPIIGDQADPHARETLTRLKSAPTFSWTPETAMAALMASERIPDSTELTASALPSESGWWWFDSPLPIQTTASDVTTHLNGLLWGTKGDGIIIECIVAINGEPLPGFAQFWRFGLSLASLVAREKELHKPQSQLPPDRIETHPEATDRLSRFCVAAFAWLQQRVLITSDGHVERHLRRRIEREHNLTLSRGVQVVQLRRSEREARIHEEHADSIEWSCRWIVNGHWRNQYHPSTGKHELKYILPYVKGPSDKPLKVPTQTVYMVNR